VLRLQFFALRASSDIDRCDLICLTNSGNSKIRTMIVRKKTDKPQLTPLLEPNSGAKTAWIASTTFVMIV